MPTFMKALPTPRRPPRCARPPERDHATPIRRTPRPRTSVQQRDGARVVRTVAVPPDVAARVDALARADTSVSAPLHAPPLLRARLARERRPIKVAAETDALARSAREAVLLNSSPEEVGCNRVERLSSAGKGEVVLMPKCLSLAELRLAVTSRASSRVCLRL